MDYERTKEIELQVVNRTRMAEGAGFEHGGAGAGGTVPATAGSQPLDRLNGRRFSRPIPVVPSCLVWTPRCTKDVP
jgi:hypothetical protein